MGIEANLLADGRRLHLHQGPIDLIIEAFGPGRHGAYEKAVQRFDGLLDELVGELPALRLGATDHRKFAGPVARRMQAAVEPLLPLFITPMAAVAGAVADEILDVMSAQDGVEKIYVNNGGDVAFYLAPGQRIEAAVAARISGRIIVRECDPYRGVATSGWRGRSHSLGIADSVSTVALNAAAADAAATLIANAVDLPGHVSIKRLRACDISPDNDLGERLVTESVGVLTPDEISDALDRGERYARSLVERDLIGGAVLTLNDQVRHVISETKIVDQTGDLKYA